MNGFNPLSGLKNWHIFTGCLFTSVGFIAIVYGIVKVILWLVHHIQII